MPPLAETQSALRDAIVAGDARAILPLLTGGRDPSYRLSVHQRHYEASLVDLLRRRFPALEWLVGEQFLKASAAIFIRQSPPGRPALGAYGADFPAFIAARPAAQSMPWLVEVGALEWALAEVAAAVELPAIGLDQFAAFGDTPLEVLSLRLQPGLGYLDCTWGVDELVKMHLEGSAPDELALVPQAVALEARGSRGAFSFRRVDRGTAALRIALADGGPLTTALVNAAAADPAFDAGAAIAALFVEGLVTEIRVFHKAAGAP